MASKTDTKRRFRPRWSLRATLIVATLCALLCARVAYKQAQYASQRQEEQVIARRVSDLGGKVHYGQLHAPSHLIGRWEHQLVHKLFGTELTMRIILVDLDFTDTNVEEFQSLGLSGLEQLETLLLYGCNQLDDRIGTDLVQLRTLQVLTLSGTSVGDDTILKLKSLPHLQNLRLQSVPNVSPEAVEEIRTRPGLLVTHT